MILAGKTFSAKINIYDDGLSLHPLFQPFAILAPLDIYLNQRDVFIPISEIKGLDFKKYQVQLRLHYKQQIIRFSLSHYAFWHSFTIGITDFNSFKENIQNFN